MAPHSVRNTSIHTRDEIQLKAWENFPLPYILHFSPSPTLFPMRVGPNLRYLTTPSSQKRKEKVDHIVEGTEQNEEGKRNQLTLLM